MVGIKVVPNGQPHAHSSFEIVLEVIEKLKTCGVKARDIFVYDRYRSEFMDAGYHKVLPADIHWGGLDPDGNQFRLDFPARANDPIAGFDHDTFVWMDLIPYGLNPKDEYLYRSHLGKLVTKTLNKIVAIPVLKDHGSAGVTGALKNMSHGTVNNVDRSHHTPFTNVCNQFIPTMVSHPIIRDKFVLQIMDGIRGVYQGGPFAWEGGKYTWEYNAPLLRDRPGVAGPRRVGPHRRQAEEPESPARGRFRQGGARPLAEGRLRRPPAAAHRPGRRIGPRPLRLQVEQGPAVLDPAPGRQYLTECDRRRVGVPATGGRGRLKPVLQPGDLAWTQGWSLTLDRIRFIPAQFAYGPGPSTSPRRRRAVPGRTTTLAGAYGGWYQDRVPRNR